MSDNLTASGHNASRSCPENYKIIITVSDVFTIFIGQPVIIKLLWTAFHSKKKDVLTINLALFHNIQYILTIIHLVMLFYFPDLNGAIAIFLFVYVLIGGPMTLTFICLERYVAVIHPTCYPLLRKYRCREVCALAVWLLVLPIATIKAISSNVDIDIKKEIDIVAYTVLSLMVIVMVWSNVAILKALRTSGPATDKLHPAKKRAFQTVRGIGTIALLCYIPVGGCAFYTLVKGPLAICETVPVVITLVSIASIAHPLFYLWTTGKLLCVRSLVTP